MVAARLSDRADVEQFKNETLLERESAKELGVKNDVELWSKK